MLNLVPEAVLLPWNLGPYQEAYPLMYLGHLLTPFSPHLKTLTLALNDPPLLMKRLYSLGMHRPLTFLFCLTEMVRLFPVSRLVTLILLRCCILSEYAYFVGQYLTIMYAVLGQGAVRLLTCFGAGEQERKMSRGTSRRAVLPMTGIFYRFQSLPAKKSATAVAAMASGLRTGLRPWART